MYKIYKISQGINDGYDTYDEAIVVAENAEQAQRMHPNGDILTTENTFNSSSWVCEISDVTVEYISVADKKFTAPQIICVSFNAG